MHQIIYKGVHILKGRISMKHKGLKANILLLGCLFSVNAVAQAVILPKKVTPRVLFQQNEQLRVKNEKQDTRIDSSISTKLKITPRSEMGGVNGGGGDAVVDQDGSTTLLDLIESGEPKFLNPIQVIEKVKGLFRGLLGGESQLVRLSVEAFKNPDDSYRWEYYLLRSIGGRHYKMMDNHLMIQPKDMIFSLTDHALEDLQDEGVIRIIEPVEKIQVAIQDQQGRVVVHRPTFEKMDEKSRAALILHEVILRFVWQYNPKLLKVQGTEPIRRLNRLLIKLWVDKEYIPDGEIVEAIQALGVPTLAK